MFKDSISFIMVAVWGVGTAILGAYAGLIPGIIWAVLGPVAAWAKTMETNQEIERMKKQGLKDGV